MNIQQSGRFLIIIQERWAWSAHWQVFVVLKCYWPSAVPIILIKTRPSSMDDGSDG